jgi:hypothetical protein
MGIAIGNLLSISHEKTVVVTLVSRPVCAPGGVDALASKQKRESQPHSLFQENRSNLSWITFISFPPNICCFPHLFRLSLKPRAHKMPTGFEAVGLALAIFPILIEAIKFYTNEKDVMSDIRNYQRLLNRISRDLDREQTIFHNSCQRFMEDIAAHFGVGEEEVSGMIHNPKDPRWTKGFLVTEEIFPRASVQQYLHAVEDMNEELSRVKELIGIQSGSTQVI